MTDMAHVDSYLVCSSGFQSECTQRQIQIFSIGNSANVCDGTFPLGRIDFPHYRRIVFAGNGCIDGFPQGNTSLTDCNIDSLHGVLSYLLPQDGSRKGVFGDDCKACGISVETVDAAKWVANALLLIIKSKCIGERTIMVSLGWVYWHGGGLINGDQVFVLVYDLKWVVGCRDIRAGGFIG